VSLDLPHPQEPWYDANIGTAGLETDRELWNATPSQRRSHARHRLCTASKLHNVRELADWDPQALAPWADYVMDFDGPGLADVSFYGWRATYGASAAAIDRLAQRIAADPPGGEYGTTRRGPDHIVFDRPVGMDQHAAARVELLVGTDDDRALALLGDLARTHDAVRGLCEVHGLWIPPNGPAIRRYISRPRSIVTNPGGPNPRLRVQPEAAGVLVDVRGPGCPAPLMVVFDLDLGLLHDGLLIGSAGRRHPFVGSNCEDCEGDEDIRDWRAWTTVDGKCRFDDVRDEVCPADSVVEPERHESLDLAPSNSHVQWGRRVGMFGGWPWWLQGPEWPGCCDRPMVFVAQASLFRFGGTGQELYGFACECGKGVQVGQMT
jgi:hypothetical protein